MANEEKLADLLEVVISKSSAGTLYKTLLKSFANENIHFVRFEKGDYLAYMGLPVERLLVLIDGQVSVFKYSHGGMSIRSGVSEAPQIYGLYETLNGTREHGVTLQAASGASCAVISPGFFLQAIKNNHKIALAALFFLAKFTDRMLDRNDQLTLNTPYDNLVIYLFEKSAGNPLPIIIDANKNEIAELMNISNRTLYRHLEQLESEGLIERKQGKIIITTSSFRNIKLKYDECRNKNGIP